MDAASASADVRALKLSGALPGGRVLTVAVQASGPRDRVAEHVDCDAGTAGRLTLDGTFGLAKTADATTLGAYDVALNVFELDPAGVRTDAPPGRITLSVNAGGEGVPLSPAPNAHTNAKLILSPSELAGVPLLGGQLSARARR